jgi:hypothetical protein
LRKDSPRLVLNEEREANLKARLETDAVVQNIYAAIKEVIRGVAALSQDGKRLTLEILSHPGFTPSAISLDPPPLELGTMKEGLKRLEIRFPAWTLEANNRLSIKVRLVGDIGRLQDEQRLRRIS